MVKYLKKLLPLWAVQPLPKDEIFELVQFSIPKEWEKEIIIQGFDSKTQGLTELVNFCEHLKTAEEIFQKHGEGHHKNKKTSTPVHATNPPSWRRSKVQTRP